MKKLYLDNKGFATAELLFVTLIILVIMAGMLSLISGEMDKTQTGNLGQVRAEGEIIAEAINTAYLNGNGYTINLDLPKYDKNDSIQFTAVTTSKGTTNFLTINYGTQSFDIQLIPKKVESYTMDSEQKYHIKNDNGTITFETY
ncbi:hypothetical protein [Methanobacterium congolense]|uniref:Uncharacterized protein n=1 Tax=Methanobacterium congolense TaxID=118062 RepID=A0A1D3L253_9EURY|nr:hypothetical protein [Methanobacterium congolense]SCG85646.1 putative protein [Methanobacterium congolense]